MPEPTFVGRESYIRKFEKLIKSPVGSPYILNLRGPGGIGKTKILQQIEAICKEEDIPNTGIIDFYGFEMSSRVSAVEKKIAASLDGASFQDFWQLREKMRGEPPHIRGEAFKKQFMSSLSEWASSVAATGKKGVLLFDTVEALRYSLVGTRLIDDWIPALSQAVVILSGRQEEGEIQFPDEIAGLVLDAEVGAFTEEEAIDYLREREVWEAIKEDSVEGQLFNLTQCRPLLLALSADWIREYAAFPSTAPAELVKNTDQDGFEKKLVENLPNVTLNPENVILPYMAHVITPFDAKLIQFLSDGIGSDEAKEILKNLSELSFVKEFIGEDEVPYYWFQDELRTLFHKYVFSDRFAWDGIRQAVSNRMIRFQDNRIQEAKEKGDEEKEQRAIAALLYHEIYLNPEKGFKKFQNMFQTARETYQYGFASLLLSPVRFLIEDLPERQRYAFELAEGRWLRDMGDAKRADDRFRELLSVHGNDPKRSPYIYNALGASALNLGKFQDALKYHQKSFELSKDFGLKNRLSLESKNIGEVYLLMGEWEKAIAHFKQAYESELNNEKIDWNRTAIISQNLGYTYGLAGEYEVGIEYVNQAISLLEKMNLKARLANAKVIHGDINRRAGRYEQALKEIQEAFPNFDEADYRNRATAYFYLGFAQWYRGEDLNDQQLITEARNSFESCIEMSRRYSIAQELPRALHEVSQMYWLLNLKEDARRSNNEAYTKAVASHDIYYAVNSLVKKAEFDHEEETYENIPQYTSELKAKFEDKGYKFPLFYGRMERISGEIAFDQKDYNQSVKHYAKGLYLISQHGGYGKYKIDKELSELDQKLEKLPLKEALDFYKQLKTYWTQQGVDKKRPKMLSWADQHISRLVFEMCS